MANHTGSSGRTNFSTLRKFTLLGLCTAAFQFQVMAASSQMITLSITRGTISDVFKAIESQSDYKFFYNNSQVDLSDQVNVNVSGGSIESVLDNVFAGTNITYKIVNNHVVLTNKTSKEAKVSIVNQKGKTVTGKVMDPNGEPLIGVNVLVKGTTIGATTDIDGNYSLDGVPANAVLEFSYIGYNSQNINIGNKNSVNITLSEDTQKLDEV
ncbi:STN domain-containing protein, partial [Parabacteroides provencensis]|uniref:STN domain-containing protein n=1 Tax=Parabacteroides provencensis TaxID=1944636 RepID=UPI001E5E5D8B